ncbi:translation initiation factor IF-2 [Desulfurispora thermophila]|uniref:translation initiation factor IF-2 n=1 Tax=Desulfurispora thermophila TaxID=265470 RepID=UPI00036BD35B|nr:translation initiation factor IF-2 [Desulfurispora thermophila]
MVKKRVFELARELNVENKAIMNKLKQLGREVKSHMSTLEDNEVELLMKEFSMRPADAGQKNVVEKSGPAAAEKEASGPVERPEPAKKTSAAVAPPARPPATGGGGGRRHDRGPGLVDRVPARPPDRRFDEREKNKKPPQPVDRQVAGQRKEQTGQPGQAAQNRQQAQPGQTGQGQPVRQGQGQPGRQGQVQVSGQGQPAGQGQRRDRGPGGKPRRPEGQRPAQGDKPNRPPQQQQRDRGPRPAEKTAGDGTAVSAAARAARNELKVPKVPEQVKALDKAKAAEKSRGRAQQNQPKAQPAKGRDRLLDAEENELEKKLRARQAGRKKQQKQEETKPAVVEKKPLVIGETVTVQELAEKMKKSAAELIKRLMMLGVLATINQEIDADTATILANEMGYEVEVKVQLDAEALLEQEVVDDPASLKPRPCVVTVMGHVDHGKTSLLDAIRQTNVIATEAGGITQHIGAYQVEHNGKKITFLDTPGHEAFTAMRARGAKVTDIAILVVAADDGVMPQTVEAINHAKAAEVPIIVAINKMDKPDAQPDRVKQQLTEHGLVSEEWGGDTICVPVSAKSKQGIDELLEMILLVAEMGELKANPDRPARGTVIEAKLDKGRGPVATVLVQNGTLQVGDNIVAGSAYGKVRAMLDDKGRRVKKAPPSMPVEVLGFHEVPQAGDAFYVTPDEKTARQVAEKRQLRKRQEELKQTSRVSLDDLFKHIKEGQVKELNLIVKADVQGSVEALRQALERLSNEEVKVKIIHGGVGAINESDIMLASASNAIIIGFNVRPDVNARRAAETEKIDIRLYRVIYDAIEDVKAAMSGLLEPEYREVALGRVEVRKVYKVSKVGTIAGCYVLEGKVVRDASVRLVRDGVVIYEGQLASLKRFKDDVREVVQGYECGIMLDNWNDIQENDIIEAYTMEAVKRELA